MGFFDKLFAKGQTDAAASDSARELPRAELDAAAEHLAAGRTAEAVAAYEELLAAGSPTGDLLTAISADLGRNDRLSEMVSLLPPVYDAAVHGAAPGINLIQAYLKLGNPDGAQMMIDLVAALDRPDLVPRLGGFMHAVDDLRASAPVEPPPAAPSPQEEDNINLVSISRPLWSYALPDGESLLPAKEGRLRSIALLPLGASGEAGKTLDPDHPANIWARGFPLVIAEALAFAPGWKARAMVAVAPGDKLFTPPRGFGIEQARDLFGSGGDPTDYVLTGGLVVGGDRLHVRLEVIDVRRRKSIKTITDSCAIDRPDAALIPVFMHLRQYLEATETLSGAVDYVPPAALAERLGAFEHALLFFLADKSVIASAALGDAPARAAALEAHAAVTKDPLAPLHARASRAILERLASG